MAAAIEQRGVLNLTILELLHPLIGLANMVGAFAVADGGGSGARHKHCQNFEDGEQMFGFPPGHDADVGTAMPGDFDNPLSAQPLQGLAHGTATDPEALGKIRLDQLLSGYIATAQHPLVNHFDNAVGRADSGIARCTNRRHGHDLTPYR